jgi:hypothetical protein
MDEDKQAEIFRQVLNVLAEMRAEILTTLERMDDMLAGLRDDIRRVAGRSPG